MNLYLDTSSFTAILKLEDPITNETKTYEKDFGREMAEKLLGFIRDKLKENQKSWQDIKKITFYSGPGSFTGLRIGATLVNALAHELSIPLYDHKGNQHLVIIPDYGRPANISAPKK
jgi:tRNA threonylcarbamoyladenosine biosynthesis protein TsaB